MHFSPCHREAWVAFYFDFHPCSEFNLLLDAMLLNTMVVEKLGKGRQYTCKPEKLLSIQSDNVSGNKTVKEQNKCLEEAFEISLKMGVVAKDGGAKPHFLPQVCEPPFH